MKNQASFFSSGCTSFFKDGEQVPELQPPWFILYIELLEKGGVDPIEVEYIMPDGKAVHVFRTDDGFNWDILPGLP